jgi:nitrite reductase (cytochrome c-552)
MTVEAETKPKGIKLTWILVGIIVVLAAILIGVLLYLKNQPQPKRGMTPIQQVPAKDPNSADWGVNFPNEYSSFLKTETNSSPTKYGGSQVFSKLERDPRLVTLYAGFSFSKDFNSPRGHMNTLTDVRATKRVTSTTAGTCYSCKSSNNPQLWDKMGMAEYDHTLFSELGKQIIQPIGCANCHEAGTMKLIVTNPALDEALKAQKKDWHTFTRQEMRTVVCANCHVTYYFKGDGKYLTFPWADGTKIEEIISYFDQTKFTEWTYPDAGTPMLKARHPEYELFIADSTHFKAGVSCADCHMPYTRDGAAKFSSHDVTSPLLDSQASCGPCHTDVDYVANRVATIQDQVNERRLATEDALIQAIDALKVAAVSPDVDKAKLDQARQLHRQAQMMWDFVASDNSMGFHNPEEVLRILAKATDTARQAQLMAIQAAGTLDGMFASQ